MYTKFTTFVHFFTTFWTMCKCRISRVMLLFSSISLLSEIYSLYRKNMTAVLSHGSDFLRFFRIVFDKKVWIMYCLRNKIRGWNFCKKVCFCKSGIELVPLDEFFKLSLKINTNKKSEPEINFCKKCRFCKKFEAKNSYCSKDTENRQKYKVYGVSMAKTGWFLKI